MRNSKPFDRNNLDLKPLRERTHDLSICAIKPLEEAASLDIDIDQVARNIADAKSQQKEIILMMGAHVIRSGVQRFIIDLMEKGYITCLATNGAGVIHDYELSLIGATTESVSRYITVGQFGLWKETSRINDIVNKAYQMGNIGMGEAIGKEILDGVFPHKEVSLFAAAYRLGIPATVHVGIGYDIINEHPNYSGAAAGETSYRDFLIFTDVVSRLEGGVAMNFGSAVMAPEVFLKALSMARNVSRQKSETIKRFTTLVCDLRDLPHDFRTEPQKDNHQYYFRPWKTMLVRTVMDGGQSYYVNGRHEDTIPALWTAIRKAENNG